MGVLYADTSTALSVISSTIFKICCRPTASSLFDSVLKQYQIQFLQNLPASIAIPGYFPQAYSISSLAHAVLNVISAQLMPSALSAESILSVSDSSLITTTGMYFSILNIPLKTHNFTGVFKHNIGLILGVCKNFRCSFSAHNKHRERACVQPAFNIGVNPIAYNSSFLRSTFFLLHCKLYHKRRGLAYNKRSLARGVINHIANAAAIGHAAVFGRAHIIGVGGNIGQIP